MKRLFDWFTNTYPGYNIVFNTEGPDGVLIHITDLKAINFSYFIIFNYMNLENLDTDETFEFIKNKIDLIMKEINI